MVEGNRLLPGEARIEIEIDCGDCPFTVAEAYQLKQRIVWSFWTTAWKSRNSLSKGMKEVCDMESLYSQESRDLKEILEEAIAAGITARDARAAELLEMAKQKSLSKVQSCGWCWIDIDPETCANAILLRMPGVRATFRMKSPGFVAEDTKLYLDNVSDYDRFEASFAGIKAAAEVLCEHGIQAEPKGGLD